jgi:hypothetical protein
MRFSLRSTLPAVLALCAALFCGSASAYVTFFGEDLNNSATVPLTPAKTPNSVNAQADFLTGLANPGVETFESLDPGAYSSLPLTFPGAGGTKLNATLVADGGSIVRVASKTTDGFGRYSVPSDTTSQFWQVTAGPNGGFTVSFDQAIAAFGFFGIDVSDFGGELSIELLRNGSVLTTLPVGNKVGKDGDIDGSVLFFGFTAEGDQQLFTSVRFLSTAGGGDVFAFDNFTIAELKRDQPVPEPGSLVLVAFGLAALAAAARRRAR